jgi:anti-sigma-K factor RskA
MNCDDLNDLLIAFAVDALDREDALAAQQHLETCRKHDVTLAEFTSATEQLALSAPAAEPPSGLRSRLLGAFDDEVAGQSPRRDTVKPERAGVVPFARRPAFAWLAAAALFVAVLGLTTWNVVLQTGENGGTGWSVSAELSGEQVDGHFWYLERQQLAVLRMEGLPQLDAGRVYQAWSVREGAPPVSLGVLSDDHVIAMEADMAGASAFAITEEPAGGSAQPTTDPIAVAEWD